MAPAAISFWVSHPESTDAPAAKPVERYLSPVLIVLGIVGIAIASVVPLMLVITTQSVVPDMAESFTDYIGFTGSCRNNPILPAVDQGCHYKAFPGPIPKFIADMPACQIPGATPKEGFTFAKVRMLTLGTNVALAVSFGLAVLTLFAVFLRGRGVLRSALLPFGLSFLCGASGVASIILFYIGVNPCQADTCSALNAVSTDLLVTCWAATPIGLCVAMLMVFAGGIFSRRWAPNPAVTFTEGVVLEAEADYLAYPQKTVA